MTFLAALGVLAANMPEGPLGPAVGMPDPVGARAGSEQVEQERIHLHNRDND